MNAPDSFDASPDSRFETLVLSRSWEWLDALVAHLPIEVRLVDLNATSRFPGNSQPSTPLSRHIVSGAAELRALVTSAAAKREWQLTKIGDLQVAAYPLTDGRTVIGAALMTHRFSARASVDVGSGNFKLLCDGIFQSIQAHLRTPPPAAPSPVDDLNSFAHVLDAAASYGTDRELVAAFAAAVAYWKQIDVYGYIPTSPDTFSAEVWPASVTEPQMLTTIPASALPQATGLTPLSAAEAEALGMHHGRNVLVARVPASGLSWLIVLVSGAIPPVEMARLGIYVRSLELLMRMVTGDAIVKLVATLSAHLLEHSEGVDAVSAALDALKAAIGMSDASLTVTGGHGAPLLQVTRGDGPPAAGDSDGDARLVTFRRVTSRYTLRLALTTADRRRVTPHQRQVAESMTTLFDAWVRHTLPQLEGRDRRTTARPFDQVLERFANDALQSGTTVSVVVVLATDAAALPGVTQQWISRIRAIMRASDIVGMLGEGEIGLLLHDTPRERAEAVAHRVVKLLEPPDQVHPSPVAAVGVATRRPNAGGSTGIAAEARSDAMARARASAERGEDASGNWSGNQPTPRGDFPTWGNSAMD